MGAITKGLRCTFATSTPPIFFALFNEPLVIECHNFFIPFLEKLVDYFLECDLTVHKSYYRIYARNNQRSLL